MDFSVEIDVEKLAADLAATAEQIRAALPGALFEQAEEIMAVSKEQYVPVDEGILRSSGVVELPIVEGDEVSITMGFGGPAKDYAVVVHESAVAQQHRERDRAEGIPRHGDWKYLETPAMEAAPTMGDRIADAIRRRLGSS